MEKNNMKKELIERYKYLYKNAGFIILPLITFRKENDNYTLNYELNNYMGYVLESFLMDDKPYNKSTLYKIVEDLKLNREYYSKFSTRNKEEFYFYLDTLNKDESVENNSNNRFVNYLLDGVRSYTEKGLRNREFVSKKLRVLDEYYRINRYNLENVFSSGYRVNVSDKNLNDIEDKYKYNILLPNIKPGLGNSKSNFIEYVSDYRNHHFKNLSILTENEKLEMFKELEPNKYERFDKVYKK